MAIIGTIYFFVNFNFQLNHSNTFFSFFQITYLQEIFKMQFGTGISMLFKLFYQLKFLKADRLLLLLLLLLNKKKEEWSSSSP